MSEILNDLRHAARRLSRTSGFTAIAVLAMAIGIGANTAIFSLVNGLLFGRQPGIEDPQRLVLLGRTQEGGGFDTFNWVDYTDFVEQSRSFSDLVAYRMRGMTILAGEGAERLAGAMVSGNYFTALGTPMAAGRPLLPTDASEPGAGTVAVVSGPYAERVWGDAGRAVGSTLRVEGQPFTVVGVTAGNFAGTSRLTRLSVWVPITMQPVLMPSEFDFFTNRGTVWMEILGRLADGVNPAQARTELQGIASRLEQAYPETNEGRNVTLAEGTDLDPGTRDSIRQAGIYLMVVVLLVLVIAASNVANLLLARAGSRRRELGVRRALGAARSRLVRHLVSESLMLSLLGAAGGVLLTFWGTDLLRLAVRLTPLGGAADAIRLDPDLRVMLFTLCLAVVTGIVFGLIPALASTRGDLTMDLRVGTGSLGGGRSPFGRLLVSGQLALSLLLMVTAGLLVRSMGNLRGIDPGFDAASVAVFELPLTAGDYPGESGRALHQRILDEVRTVPGVEAVSLSQEVPLDFGRWDGRIQVPGLAPPEGERGHRVEYRIVTPDYFRTMGIPIIRGNTLSGGDTQGGSWEVVVNRTAAERFWPGEDAVGKTVGWEAEFGRWVDARVVGVARDAAYNRLSTLPHPHLYVSFSMVYNRNMVLHVRATDPMAIIGPVRGRIADIDANLPVLRIRTLQQQFDVSIGDTRVAAQVSGLFALIALILAVLGLYGTVSWYVRQRTREIGVRMALGASSSGVVNMVVRQGMRLLLTGTVVGLVAALGLTRILAGLLHEVSPTDPLTLAATVAILGAAGWTAAWIPARRATRVDPVSALRQE